MSAAPLIRCASVEAPFAFRGGRTIPVGQFLSDVEHLARLLPARRYLLNLCSDRYRFAVGFAAALLRGQVSLLPPDHTADLVAQLQEGYKDVYCLTEDAGAHASLPTVVYPAAAVAGSTSVSGRALDLADCSLPRSSSRRVPPASRCPARSRGAAS